MKVESVLDPHPEGWARRSATLKRVHERVLQHSAVPSPRFSVGITMAFIALLSVYPAIRLFAQSSVDQLALRFAGMTAVTGLEQAMTDTLLTLVPGSTRDRAGNVTMSLGKGVPKRLVACALDEVGYVVGNITADGYLTLRRVGAPPQPLFDQQLEGQRVTVFAARGAVPGVGAVRSTHLTRGRIGSGTPDPVFTVDNAYVDVGAASAAEARALAAALQAKPAVRGSVVAAFTVRSLYTTTGLQAVQRLQGPFDQALVMGGVRGARGGGAAADTLVLATRYTDTAVETVSLKDADALAQRLVAWMEAR